MDGALSLLNHLEGAAVRALRRQNALAVAASGGLDSSVLAALLARHAEVPLVLVTAAAPGASDSGRARALARHLGLPLVEVVLSSHTVTELLHLVVDAIEPEDVDETLAEEWGLPKGTRRVSPIRVAVGIVLLACSRAARPFAKRLVLGQGADELFAGYARYQQMPADVLATALKADLADVQGRGVDQERNVAKISGTEGHYPYLDPRVVAHVQAMDPGQHLHPAERKPLLRAVARILDLPPLIVDAPKTAAQYGSGVGAILATIAERAGRPQNELFTELAAQRRTGDPHSLRT